MTKELLQQLTDAGLGWDDDRPNLSELVQACGDKFNRLDNMGTKGSIGPWEATSMMYPEEGGAKGHFALGDIPEEAVARLWIALNKK